MVVIMCYIELRGGIKLLTLDEGDIVNMSPLYARSRTILGKRVYKTKALASERHGGVPEDQDDWGWSDEDETESFDDSAASCKDDELEGGSSVDVEVGEPVEELFSAARIFAFMSVYESKVLYTSCEHISLVAGETLCRAGDTDVLSGLFVVQQGSLDVYADKFTVNLGGLDEEEEMMSEHVKVGNLRVGDSVGDLELLDGTLSYSSHGI